MLVINNKQSHVVTNNLVTFQPFSTSDLLFLGIKLSLSIYIFYALKYRENQFSLKKIQCQISFNKELGERSHPNVNNVFLEGESFLHTICNGTQDLNVFDKSSIKLIIFKIYLLGSFKDKEHIFIIVALLALTTSINICSSKPKPCIQMFVEHGTMVVVMFTK